MHAGCQTAVATRSRTDIPGLDALVRLVPASRALSDESERCCFDDRAGCYARRARRRRLGAVSNDLIHGLDLAGLKGRTVLDVGCGAGGLVLETLERGADTVTGIDLSTAAIEQARRISSERGLSDRTTFAVADGASVGVPPHDVVVLDKVFCCYADVDGLLRHSLPAARSVYGFSVPPSAGFSGAPSAGCWPGSRTAGTDCVGARSAASERTSTTWGRWTPPSARLASSLCSRDATSPGTWRSTSLLLEHEAG